jgi:hypothetical protein
MERESGDLDDLESNAGKIADGPTGPAHAGDENAVVIVDQLQRTIAGDERGDDFALLFQLNADGLANGGVGLLGVDGDFVSDDPFERVV